METILTGIFWTGVGMTGLVISITCAICFSKTIVDIGDYILQGKPEGLVFVENVKIEEDNGYKTDPLPIMNIEAGSMF